MQPDLLQKFSKVLGKELGSWEEIFFEVGRLKERTGCKCEKELPWNPPYTVTCSTGTTSYES